MPLTPSQGPRTTQPHIVRPDLPTRGLLTGRLILSPDTRTPGTRLYDCLFIGAGRVRQADGELSKWLIPAEVLQDAVPLFEGAASYLDHPSLFGFGWHQAPSVRDLVGVCSNAYWDENEQGIAGTIRLYDEEPGSAGALLAALHDQMLEDRADGLPVPDIGLSAVLWHTSHLDEDSGLRVTDEITAVDSVDHVYAAGARGYVRAALSRLGLNRIVDDGRHIFSLGASAPNQGGPEMAPETKNEGQQVESPGVVIAKHPEPPSGARGTENAGSSSPAVITQYPEVPRGTTQHLEALSSAVERINDRLDHIEESQALLAEERTVEDMGTPPRGTIYGMVTGYDQVVAAAEALLAGARPPDGIRPLSGIRELYTLLSGDYEMTGLFQDERVYLANVTSSTMAQIVANVLNKRVMVEFAQYPQWWRPIVTIESFTSLQQVRWITLGGVGELPTVTEGAAYTELTWDDLGQRDSFVKKGGYLGLTIEAIDKDDTRRVQSAPRALAQAAWLTLSKSISTIFTYNSGVGPNVYYDDSNQRALFHTSNGNLGTSALSAASWEATRIAMRKQTELNSSERLGALTAPRYCLVPPDLEFTAIQVIATAHIPGSANYNINPEAAGDTREARLRAARERVIVVDLWTDTNNWAAVADPALYPSIGLGFRFGETPEVFSVADPRAGLMFSNDVMPVKVRFFYATGPVDYRGLYKHNVS